MKSVKKALLFITLAALVVNAAVQILLFEVLLEPRVRSGLLYRSQDRSDRAKSFLNDTVLCDPLQVDMIDDEPVWVAYWMGEKTFFSDTLEAVIPNATQDMTDADRYFSFLRDGGVASIDPQRDSSGNVRYSYGQLLYGKDILPCLRDLRQGGRLQRICGRWCSIDRVTLFLVANNGFFAYLETDQGVFIRLYGYDTSRKTNVTVELSLDEYENLRSDYWAFMQQKEADGEKQLGSAFSLWDYMEHIDYEVHSPSKADINPIWFFVRLAASAVLTAVTVTVGIIVIKKRGCKKAAPAEK